MDIGDKIKSRRNELGFTLKEVADCIYAAYHRGKSAAGAEMIDDNAVYINSIDRIIEWDKEFNASFVDKAN